LSASWWWIRVYWWPDPWSFSWNTPHIY